MNTQPDTHNVYEDLNTITTTPFVSEQQSHHSRYRQQNAAIVNPSAVVRVGGSPVMGGASAGAGNYIEDPNLKKWQVASQ